jgi:hypothetical protein
MGAFIRYRILNRVKNRHILGRIELAAESREGLIRDRWIIFEELESLARRE